MPAVTSLDLPVGAEEASRIGDFIQDEKTSDTLEEVLQALKKSRLKRAIERLSARGRYVLIRRYGLDNDDPATLTELSRELGLSKERAYRLQCETERILREEGQGVPSGISA